MWSVNGTSHAAGVMGVGGNDNQRQCRCGEECRWLIASQSSRTPSQCGAIRVNANGGD